MTSSAHLVALTCHPQTRAGAVRAVTVKVWQTPDAMLALAFSLDGDLDRLRLPPPRPSRTVHGLWRHTCFEAFVAVNGTAAYREFNFAPSGEWAAYAFRGYRDGAPVPDDAPAPEIIVRRAADRLELDALIRLDDSSATHAHAPLRLGLAAVIEERHGALSYWALRHPAANPDFHHPDAFALTLNAPGVDSAINPG
jgi:hypothetical protein